MTVPEVRALLTHLLEVRVWDVDEILWWSHWRRERNRRAAASHRKRRAPSFGGGACEVGPGTLRVRASTRRSSVAESRGEVWRGDVSPTRGTEQSGVRPVLIIQNNMDLKHDPAFDITEDLIEAIRSFPVRVSSSIAALGSKSNLSPSMRNARSVAPESKCVRSRLSRRSKTFSTQFSNG